MSSEYYILWFIFFEPQYLVDKSGFEMCDFPN